MKTASFLLTTKAITGIHTLFQRIFDFFFSSPDTPQQHDTRFRHSISLTNLINNKCFWIKRQQELFEEIEAAVIDQPSDQPLDLLLEDQLSIIGPTMCSPGLLLSQLDHLLAGPATGPLTRKMLKQAKLELETVLGSYREFTQRCMVADIKFLLEVMSFDFIYSESCRQWLSAYRTSLQKQQFYSIMSTLQSEILAKLVTELRNPQSPINKHAEVLAKVQAYEHWIAAVTDMPYSAVPLNDSDGPSDLASATPLTGHFPRSDDENLRPIPYQTNTYQLSNTIKLLCSLSLLTLTNSQELREELGVGDITVFSDIASQGLKTFIPINSFTMPANINFSLEVVNGDTLPTWIDFDAHSQKYRGKFNLDARINDIMVVNEHCFLATTKGIVVLDVSDIGNITVLSEYGDPGSTEGVFIQGDRAYIASLNGDLHIVDISNPTNLKPISMIATPGQNADVVVDNQTLILASRDVGVHFIDIANETNPTITSHFFTNDTALQLKIDTPGILYIADDSDGIQTVNYHNLSRVFAVSSTPTPGFVQGIDFKDGFLAAADDFKGVQFFNKTTKTFTGGYDTPHDAKKVALDNGIAYIADGDAGLQLVNASTANWIGEYPLPGEQWSVTISGDQVFVGGTQALYVLDKDPYLGTVTTHARANFRLRAPIACRVYARSETAETFSDFTLTVGNFPPEIIGDADTAQLFIDQSIDLPVGLYDKENDPLTPVIRTIPNQIEPNFDVVKLKTQFINCLAVEGRIRDMVYGDNHLYLANDFQGVTTVSISETAQLRIVGSFINGMQYRHILKKGHLLFATANTNGLVILDATNPSSPIFIGQHSTGDRTRGLDVHEDLCLIAANSAGLLIYNVSNPSAPQFLSQFSTSASFSRGVYYHQGHALVADGGNGFVVINIEDPRSPHQVGRIETGGFAQNIVVRYNLAYLSSSEGGVKILDISNLTSLSMVKDIRMTEADNALTTHLLENFAFVANVDAGFQVLDISNPYAPQINTRYYLPSNFDTFNLAISDRFAFVNRGAEGICSLMLPNVIIPNHAIRANFQSGAQGVYEASIVVTDSLGATSSESVTLHLPNRAPVIANRRSKITVRGGEQSVIELADLFVDPDNDTLILSFLQPNLELPPIWFEYFAETMQAILTPPESSSKTRIIVTASDGFGGRNAFETEINVEISFWISLMTEDLVLTLTVLLTITFFFSLVIATSISKSRIKTMASIVKKYIELSKPSQDSSTEQLLEILETTISAIQSLSPDDLEVALATIIYHYSSVINNENIVKGRFSIKVIALVNEIVEMILYDLLAKEHIKYSMSTLSCFKLLETTVRMLYISSVQTGHRMPREEKQALLDSISRIKHHLSGLDDSIHFEEWQYYEMTRLLVLGIRDDSSFRKLVFDNLGFAAQLEFHEIVAGVINTYANIPHHSYGAIIALQHSRIEHSRIENVDQLFNLLSKYNRKSNSWVETMVIIDTIDSAIKRLPNASKLRSQLKSKKLTGHSLSALRMRGLATTNILYRLVCFLRARKHQMLVKHKVISLLLGHKPTHAACLDKRRKSLSPQMKGPSSSTSSHPQPPLLRQHTAPTGDNIGGHFSVTIPTPSALSIMGLPPATRRNVQSTEPQPEAKPAPSDRRFDTTIDVGDQLDRRRLTAELASSMLVTPSSAMRDTDYAQNPNPLSATRI